MAVTPKTGALPKIRRLLDLDPTLTYDQVAAYCGVSKQRVHQLVEQHDLPKSSRWNETSRKCAGGCGRRLNRKTNLSGWCRACSILANAYEFMCHGCGKLNVVTGDDAVNRRQNLKHKKHPGLDFCGNSCSSTYFGQHKINQQEE
jgi:hypothetical protein